MKLGQRDAIVKALLARGERKVDDRSLSRVWKFTRGWMAMRNVAKGTLIPASPGTFWFVSRSNGAVRYGRTSTGSMALAKNAKDALVTEGRALP